MHRFTVDGPDQTDVYIDNVYSYSIVNGTAMWLRECDRLVSLPWMIVL